MLIVEQWVKFDDKLNKVGSASFPIDILVSRDKAKGYLRLDKWCYEFKCMSKYGFTRQCHPMQEMGLFMLDSVFTDYLCLGDSYWLWESATNKSYSIYFSVSVESIVDDVADLVISTIRDRDLCPSSISTKSAKFHINDGTLIIFDTTERVGSDLQTLAKAREVIVPKVSIAVPLKEVIFGAGDC